MRDHDPVTRLMTEAVLSVDVDAPVSEALRLFAEYPVHHLPVVRERVLVGMLSSADVMKLEGFLPKKGRSAREYLDQRFRIDMLMRQPAISVQPQQTAEDAARLMVRHGIHALPVVNGQNHLVGIVTTTDLMQAALNARPQSGPHTDAAPDLTSIQRKPDLGAFGKSLRAAHDAILGERDPDGIACSLLYLYQRNASLEDIHKAVQRYLTAGQDEMLHATLMKAMVRAEQLEERARAEPAMAFGLAPT